jgi:drug/metabolite transporter (DMT)-like permease
VLSSGELAALGTATAWTGSSLAMEGAARRIGSLVLNVIRLVLAFGLLSGLAAIVRGVPLPVDATAEMWGWLAVSGLIGFVFGDLCLFRALAEISARLTMLIQTTAPIFAALLGWAVLGERLPWLAVGGLVMVVVGVAWAIAARTRGGALGGAHLARGVVLALCGALGQAGGLVLSKRGLGTYSAVSGTQIRVLAAVVGFAAVVTVARAWPRVRAALRDRAAMKLTVAGALLGPCIGVSLSLYAVAHAPAGVAAALMATPPILVLPIAWRRGERVGVAGVLGAVVAVAGVALIVTA